MANVTPQFVCESYNFNCTPHIPLPLLVSNMIIVCDVETLDLHTVNI